MQETRVWPLAQEDLLVKGMATHSSILPWRNPLDREAWGATVQGVTKSQTQLSTQYIHTHTHTHRSNLLYANYTSIQLFLKRQSYTSPPVHSTKIQTYSGIRLIKLINKSGKNSDRIICLSSVQSLSHVQLFAIPWTTARQASLSITNSQSLLKLMSSASRGSKKYTRTQELCESFSLKNFLILNRVFTAKLQECLKDAYLTIPCNTFTVSCPEKVLHKYYRMNKQVNE